MVYVDTPFPPRIAMGAQRRPGWKTNVVQMSSGHEATNQEWSKARHSYDLSFAVRTVDDYAAVQDHFHVMRGRAKFFPFKDIVDYKATALNGVLYDDGSSPSYLQLAKTYGTGADKYTRIITRPRTGYVNIYRLRTGVTTDITANVSISATTGIVTLVTPGAIVGTDVLSWAGEFWVPCRYDTDELPTLIVDRNPGTDGKHLVRCDSIPLVEVRE